MKDLDVAKSLIASLGARLAKITEDLGAITRASLVLGSEAHAIHDELEEVLGVVCLADVRADADDLIERAREAQAHE